MDTDNDSKIIELFKSIREATTESEENQLYNELYDKTVTMALMCARVITKNFRRLRHEMEQHARFILWKLIRTKIKNLPHENVGGYLRISITGALKSYLYRETGNLTSARYKPVKVLNDQPIEKLSKDYFRCIEIVRDLREIIALEKSPLTRRYMERWLDMRIQGYKDMEISKVIGVASSTLTQIKKTLWKRLHYNE